MKSLVLVLVLLIAGCASQSSIVVGKTRPAISPEQVKLYLRPPKKYEEVALIESSSKASWAASDQGKINVVVERLKDEAAKLGANGILLQGTSNQSTGSVSTGTAQMTSTGNSAFGTGFGVSAGIMHKAGSGIAIYVEEE